MSKKFLTKVVLATVLASGINLLPMPNFDAGNVQISVAYAESKNFAAKEAAMTDVEIIEAQAKEASRLRAIEAVKEKIASYVRNFSGAKGKLNEDDIAAIAEKFEEVGEAKYKKLFYNAVDEEGKELGKVGIMYEATVTAKFNSKKITEYIKLTEQEKERRIRQAREAREHFEELDREYEELRKNARTKTPEQLQSDIKIFDDKISNLEKSRGKNKSVKKDKQTTQKDKVVANVPMKFSNSVTIGEFGAGDFTGGGCLIDNASYISETPVKKYERDEKRWVYFKGTARFGNGEDALYFHYDMKNNPCYKFGGSDVKNTIPYDDWYGAKIFKVNATNGYVMYFLRKEYTAPAPNIIHYILIGCRPDGKWVKYFDTENLCKQYMGDCKNVSIQKIIPNGDTITLNYARSTHPSYAMAGYFHEKEADEFGEFRFKWDEAAKWFSVEKVDSQNKPALQKPSQENKPVTNQPMQFSQSIQIGEVGYINLGGFLFKQVNKNDGVLSSTQRLKNRSIYDHGVAVFGNGTNALYFHYDSYKANVQGKKINVITHGFMKFGDSNINNTVTLKLPMFKVFSIENNQNRKFYMINSYYDIPEDFHYDLIGKTNNGKWAKYFDTGDIVTKYFGPRQGYGFEKFKLLNDTIIIPYKLFYNGRYNNPTERGEFRFKWDESAQWFSVEQIKY